MNELLELKGLEALKVAVEAELSVYNKINVNDDDSYKNAKKDRATLNKLSKAVDTERKRLAKELKNNVDEIILLVDTQINFIDEQTNAWENKLKEDRKIMIDEKYFNLNCPVSLERIFDEKWLNITCDWEKELLGVVDKINRDIEVIKMISSDETLLNIYFECLDVALAKTKYDQLHFIDEIKDRTITFKSTQKQYDNIINYIKSLGL